MTTARTRGVRLLAGGSAFVLLTGVASATQSAAQPTTTFAFAHSADLFTSTTPAAVADAADAAPPVDAHATRSRVVEVNSALLPATVSAPKSITLNVFPDATFAATVQRTEFGLGTQSWAGTVPDGYFYASRADNVTLVHVATPKGVYEVSNIGGGSTYRAIELDPDEPELNHDVLHGYVASKTSDTAAKRRGGDSSGRIDVMILYTPQALAEEGSEAGMRARIALAVTETNGGYANSGITTRLRLVHQEEVDYNESGSFDKDLTRLAGTRDGYMDKIHELRNIYGADMVSMIIRNTDYCGLAYTIKATAAQAFTVVSRSCATGYYSTGHEFGHLQGARHDTYVDNTNTPYAYGHGFVNLGRRFRTIMAYNDRCTAAGVNCVRLQYWSNPNRKYRNKPVGVSSTQNFRVLNATDTATANFRLHTIGENADNEFSGGASGYRTVRGHWIKGDSVYRTNGLYKKVASSARIAKYGDVTYEVKMKRTGGSSDDIQRVFLRGTSGHLNSQYAWKPSYMFQYTNSGMFSVWRVVSNGHVVAIKPWARTGAIHKGSWNVLRVVGDGNRMSFGINGRTVWRGKDSSIRVGQVGFGYYRSTGHASLSVDWARVTTTATANVSARDVAPSITQRGGTVLQAPHS